MFQSTGYAIILLVGYTEFIFAKRIENYFFRDSEYFVFIFSDFQMVTALGKS